MFLILIKFICLFMIQKIRKDGENKRFIMDLELIAKWLDTKKKDLKETLKTSYMKNINYIILSVNRQKSKPTTKINNNI